MPLVFSPLSEELLELPPKRLYPRSAFVMRQIGAAPRIDSTIHTQVVRLFKDRGIGVVDATGTTGGKDYLERILGLIRGTGFTVAIFSHETRATALANISLELGFAAMCGKPLVIVKSPEAVAPSDLKRTDWIDFENGKPTLFNRKLGQALEEVQRLADFENDLIQASLEARSPDCAVARERANKGFLLSGEMHFVTAAERILKILEGIAEGSSIADLERLRSETRTFIRQARAASQ